MEHIKEIAFEKYRNPEEELKNKKPKKIKYNDLFRTKKNNKKH